MYCKAWLALAPVIVVGTALAQSEQDVRAAVGKELDAYTSCLKQRSYELAKGDDEENVIVGNAIAACSEERHILSEASQKAPLNLSADDANKQINQMILALREKMLRTIREARGL
jgi:hypothetical protein